MILDHSIYRLVRYGFDNLENHNPHYEETVGLFPDLPNSPALGRIEAWKEAYLAKWPPFKGWDGETYPKWSVVEDPVL